MRKLAVLVMLLPAVASADDYYMKLDIGTPKVSGTGSIDVKSMMATLGKAHDTLQPCYGATLERDPHTKATAIVTFSIGVDGKTSAGKAIGLDKASNACLVSVVSKLVFAKQKGNVAVSVAMDFSPPTKAVDSGAFASLTGTGDISSGFDDTNIYGGLLGNEAGEMNGGYGYGSAGFGPGGGGTGWGTIGTGRYGTIGHGSGTSSGYGVGGGRGGMRGKYSEVPTVSVGQPTVQGDLDKAIIRRYIKRNIQKIQYCYEKQLLQKKGLAGTVKAEFTIDAHGVVTDSKASGMKDKDVEQCIADVIKGIEFPKPKGDGSVVASFPFTFRPAGN